MQPNILPVQLYSTKMEKVIKKERFFKPIFVSQLIKIVLCVFCIILIKTR